jgi:hypothetical protein
MSSECFDLDSTVPQAIERDFKIKEEPVAAPKVKLHVLVHHSFISFA